ncbi:MAG: EamA family transporter [Phaeodactylibacter sp.]|nr:EamA family transporter [Phaeodactylibacter sp.]
MNARIQAHIALFFVALIYGGNYSFAKLVLETGYLQPRAFILLRVLAGLTFFTLLHFTVIRKKVERADLLRLALCGLFGVAINQLFFFMGLHLTKPINASLIMTTTPILVLVISALLIGERITARKIIGILLGATGAILLVGAGQQISFEATGFLGDLLVFINAASYGIYLVIVKKMMLKYHPFTVLRWMFTFGLFMVLPFSIQELPDAQWSDFTPLLWWSLAYVLFATTILAYLLNGYALKVVNPSTASIYIYLQPVLAALIAILLRHDTLDPIKLISATLIFAGVFLVSRSARAKNT